MEEIKQLDTILKCLCEYPKDNLALNIQDQEKLLKAKSIPVENIHPIFNKLEKEGYVDISYFQGNPTNHKLYKASFDGIILNAAGGYSKKNELTNSLTTMAKNGYWISFWLAVFAGLAALYYSAELVKLFFFSHHSCK